MFQGRIYLRILFPFQTTNKNEALVEEVPHSHSNQTCRQHNCCARLFGKCIKVNIRIGKKRGKDYKNIGREDYAPRMQTMSHTKKDLLFFYEGEIQSRCNIDKMTTDQRSERLPKAAVESVKIQTG